MRKLSVQPRGIAFLTGGILAASAFVPVLGAATARADEKSDRRSKQYKTGAVVLGAAAAYFALKSKKPLPAAVAGAAAYYAYKKGKDLKNQSDRDRYGYDPNADRNAQYPTDDGRDSYDYRGRDAEPATYPDENGSYNNGGTYAGNGSYDNGDYASNDGDNGDYTAGRDAYSRFPDYSARSLASRKRPGAKIKVK